MLPKDVTGTPPVGVPAPAGTPAPSGTPAVVPAPSGATPPAPADDPSAKITALETKVQQYEQDIRKLKSASDRRLYETESTYKSQLDETQARLEALATANMDDDERRAYELEKLQHDRQQLQTQLEEAQQALELERQTMGYLGWLQGLGIDVTKLDRSDPNALGASAAEAIANRIRDLESKATVTQPPGSPPPTPGPTGPALGPTVVSGVSGGSPASKPTFEELKASVSAKLGRPVRDDEIFDLARRGEVDLNNLI